MKRFIFCLVFLFSVTLKAQLITNGFSFNPSTDIRVMKDGDSLVNAWAGGLNYVHFNTYDLDKDGIEDLLLFEKTGGRIIPFLNKGIENGRSKYKYAPKYNNSFPPGEGFYLLRDYNCDGKKDVFIGMGGGIVVYENTSSGDVISFQKAHSAQHLEVMLSSGESILSVPNGDVPGIEDIDGDGDLDILTFDAFNSTKVYWMENKDPCGLDFVGREMCWGHFSENGSSNDISLNACTPQKPKKETTNSSKEKTLHAGSALLPLDLNGDEVTDLLVSDVSFPNVYGLYNSGTPDSAFMSSKDSAFPSYNVPVDIPHFPSMFYEDVTGDGNRDLILSPNENSFLNSGFTNHDNLWMYENTGTDSDPVFSFQEKNYLRNTQIDVGEGSVPRFVDINGDSLQDIILANNFYETELGVEVPAFMYIKNIGLPYFPIYEITDTNFANISSYGIGKSLIPTFGDLDGDGDLDMIIGDENGQMHLFTNTGNRTDPQYTLTTPGINSADVGHNAAPFLFDMDKDGDLDLVVGKKNGRLSYFENLSATNPQFYFMGDYLGGVDVTQNGGGGYSIPYVFEYNDNINLIVGSSNNGILQYDSISSVIHTNTIRGQVGNGTLESDNYNESPFGTDKSSGRNQMLFLADELKAAGLSYGYITGLTFEITTANNPTLHNGLIMTMKNVSYNELVGDFDSNMRVVITDNRPKGIGSGFFYMDLETPFLWDGESNLLIQICFKGNSSRVLTKLRMSETSFKSNAYGDVIGQPNGCFTPYLASINKRPNIEFELVPSFVNTATLFGDGVRNAPAVADINGDRYVDAVVGNYGGGLTLYLGKKFNVGTPESEKIPSASLLVYPNPGNGLFTVSTENMSEADISVFNLTGKLVRNVKATSKNTTVDISTEPAGIYLFILNDGKRIRSQKVILQ